MSAKKDHSPFRSYSVNEILATESSNYMIQVGFELLNIGGNFLFNKKSAVTHYNKILREILNQLKNGNKKQQANAERMLSNFKIIPFRLH